MVRVRDYHNLVHRLETLSRTDWTLQQVGEIWGYPFFCVRRMVSRHAPTVFLSGGMHGEEPGGVEGVLRWLESDDWTPWPVNWFILPCINPYGWERNQRTNAQRRDINRHFRDPSNCPEAELIKRLVNSQRFLFSLEFHEDVDTSGYYLYELRREPPFVGEKILAEVSKIIPISRHKVIEGNPTVAPGLIRRDANRLAFQKRRRWPMAYYLYLNCTYHVLGSETPVSVSLECRSRAHHAALNTALAALLHRK